LGPFSEVKEGLVEDGGQRSGAFPSELRGGRAVNELKAKPVACFAANAVDTGNASDEKKEGYKKKSIF
jgi:hypothetical protein